MKKSFLSALALGCALGTSAATGQTPLQVTKVAEGIWAAQPETGANVGWFVLGDGVVAVDSGAKPVIARAVLEKIAETARKPVRTLILTHAHADHVGGARVFAAAGAQVICHENAAAVVASFLLAPPDPKDPADAKAPSGPVQSFSERLVLVGADRQANLYWLGPAHTNGDVVVYLPKDRTLFSGDVAINARMPFMQSTDCDPAGWERLLVRLAGLQAENMIPGHGQPGPPAGIQITGAYVQTMLRLARMLVAKEVPEEFYRVKASEPEYRIEGVPLNDQHLANIKAVVRFEQDRVKKAGEKKG